VPDAEGEKEHQKPVADAHVHVVAGSENPQHAKPGERGEEKSPTVLTVMRIERGKIWSDRRACTSAATATSRRGSPRNWIRRAPRRLPSARRVVPFWLGRKIALKMR
jgi:hypothetical protein